MDYKKVLLLHFTQGLSGRSIAEVTGVSKSAINEFLKRFRESKELYYPLPEDVTNETIAALLYKIAGNPSADLYRDFNIEDVHRALTRKGETLKHLWKKYNVTGRLLPGCITSWQVQLHLYRQHHSMFAEPAKPQKVDRLSNRLKPVNRNEMVAGVYKDDDEKYSLQNLLKRQEEGDL